MPISRIFRPFWKKLRGSWRDATDLAAAVDAKPALGTTSTTAHRGDHGSTAYTHSQSAHAPSDAPSAGSVTSQISASLASHIAAVDPHTQYTTAAEAAASAPVQSVSGKTGNVTLVKADVGLGNVDNTSDANKPIGTATQTALDGKQASLVSGTNIKTVNGTSLLGSGDLVVSGGGGGATNLSISSHNATTLQVNSDTGTDITLPAATTSLSGLLTASDKLRIDNSASLSQLLQTQTYGTRITVFGPTNHVISVAVYGTNIRILWWDGTVTVGGGPFYTKQITSTYANKTLAYIVYSEQGTIDRISNPTSAIEVDSSQHRGLSTLDFETLPDLKVVSLPMFGTMKQLQLVECENIEAILGNQCRLRYGVGSTTTTPTHYNSNQFPNGGSKIDPDIIDNFAGTYDDMMELFFLSLGSIEAVKGGTIFPDGAVIEIPSHYNADRTILTNKGYTVI